MAVLTIYPPDSHQSHNAVYWRTGGWDARKPIAFRFSSLAENWGVHAKLIYKYQILSGSQNEFRGATLWMI